MSAHHGAERETDTPWKIGMMDDELTVSNARGRVVARISGQKIAWWQRVVNAINAQALSDAALARLEQTWRTALPSGEGDRKQYCEGYDDGRADCADELAALRARGETSGETK